MVPTRSGSPWLSVSVTCKWHRLIDALQQSTLARYLPMLGPDVTAVPNAMQPYLAGIGPTVKSRLKLQFRSGTAAVAHRTRAGHKAQQEAGDCLQPVSLLWA